MAIEREIKCRMESAPRARSLLRGIGARKAGPRRFEDNWVFDLPGDLLRRAGKLLRLRRLGGRWVLTYKEPAGPRLRPGTKIRREWETEVSDGEAVRRLLEGCGFACTFRYQKWRTRWARGRGLHIELDETPAGVFLELEGTQREIDRAARDLGVGPAGRIVLNYAALWEDHRRREGRGGRDMVFR